MNQEFTKIKSENVTRYILENGSGGATSGGTSSASVGGGSYAMPIGGIQRRKPGQNLISQEAKEKEAPKPRNFVAKNAKMGGAGQHRDKKKEIKQGVEKHKKPYAEDVTASSISSPHGPAAVAGAQRGGFAGLDAEMGDKADKETLAAYQIKIMNKQAELEIAKKLGGVPPKFGKDGTGIFSGMNALEFPKWLDAHPQYVDAILGITGTATPNKSQNRRSQTVNVPPVPTAGQTSMTDYKSTSEGHDDNGGEEYNDEVGMADSNIHTIIRSAKELINALEPMENMPEWAQDKLAQVKGMLVSVKDYVESQHEQGNIYHTNEGLGDEFSQFLKDKGIKHRVAGSPEQERQRTQDMMAQRAKDRANAPAPAAPSPEAIAQAKEKLAMLSKQFDPNYQYSDDHSFWTKQHQLAQQIDSLKKFISRGEVGVAEGAPELLKQEMPLVRHIERELAQHGYEKGTPEYNEVFKHTISMYRKFGNVDAIKQGVAEGKADYNFDIEDLKRLERIRDLPTLKTQALALISKPSVKPMKPEKVEWFKNALDNQRMNSPMKVIKLMYDLLLSGEGNAVVGTRSSMNPNSYRQRFGEQGVAEEGYGTHPSQRVDPRTGKKYVPPKSPLGKGVAEAVANPFALARSMKNKGYNSHKPNVGEDAYIESLFAQLEERAKK